MKTQIILLLLSFVCSVANAQKFKVKQNGVNYTYRILSESKKMVALVQVPGDVEIIIVPENVTYKGEAFTVTRIGTGSFLCGLGLSAKYVISGTKYKKVILPETITTIDPVAFSNCPMLEEINMPKSLRNFNICSFQRSPLLDLDKLDAEYFAATGEHALGSKAQLAGLSTPPTNTIQQPVTESPKQPSSDIDIDIPLSGKNNDNIFVLAIANENYQNVSHVDYAINDGLIFKEYCNKTLGIPTENIEFLQDATFGNMANSWRWLENLSDAIENATYIIYYAGHGIPNEATGDAYLLPVDGDGSNYETGHSLQGLYNRLGHIKAKNIFVFLDACFSGTQRGEGMLTSARGVAIKSKATMPSGNMVVFSASQNDETAYPYKEKEHGLFTYFMLKKLRDSNGDITMKELGEYIITNVKRYAMISNKKKQTPSISASKDLGEDWESLKF